MSDGPNILSPIPGILYLCFGLALYSGCYGILKLGGQRTGQWWLFCLLLCGFFCGLGVFAHGINLLMDRDEQIIQLEYK